MFPSELFFISLGARLPKLSLKRVKLVIGVGFVNILSVESKVMKQISFLEQFSQISIKSIKIGYCLDNEIVFRFKQKERL